MHHFHQRFAVYLLVKTQHPTPFYKHFSTSYFLDIIKINKKIKKTLVYFFIHFLAMSIIVNQNSTKSLYLLVKMWLHTPFRFRIKNKCFLNIYFRHRYRFHPNHTDPFCHYRPRTPFRARNSGRLSCSGDTPGLLSSEIR